MLSFRGNGCLQGFVKSFFRNVCPKHQPTTLNPTATAYLLSQPLNMSGLKEIRVQGCRKLVEEYCGRFPRSAEHFEVTSTLTQLAVPPAAFAVLGLELLAATS